MLAEAVVELNDKVNSVTNHAPTVVTVTNECTRQHWPEPIDLGMGKDAERIRDGLHRGPIPNDWVMGTNGYMVPPNSPEAWPTNSNIRGGYYINGGVPNSVNVEAGE